MTTVFELKIVGEIPDDNTDLGPEAQVATKPKVTALVEELTKMGLLNVVGTRRVSQRTGPREAKVAPAAGNVPQTGEPANPLGAKLPPQGLDAAGQPTAAVRAALTDEVVAELAAQPEHAPHVATDKRQRTPAEHRAAADSNRPLPGSLQALHLADVPKTAAE